MPDGLRDKLKAAAETNSRSMNSEIVARLEASFEIGGLMQLGATAQAQAELTKAVEKLTNALNENAVARALMEKGE